MFSAIYFFLLILFLIVWGVVITLVWALTVPFDPKRRILAYTTHIHAKALFALCPCWKIKIEGKENLEKGKHYLIVSNHQDLFDIPLLHMLKFNVRWVSKRELLMMPFVGHALLIHNDILLKRGDSESTKHMMKRGLETLRSGVSVAIFPEGTRTKSGRVNRFREGAFVLAKEADVEILPIAIEGAFTSRRNGWRLVTPHTFYVKVLPALSVDVVREKSARELAVQCCEIITAEHRKIREDLY